MSAASSEGGGPAGRPTSAQSGRYGPGSACSDPSGEDPSLNLGEQPRGRGQPQRGPVQAVRDQHVGRVGGAVHGGRLQRRDAGVGPGCRISASGQQLGAQVGEVPAPGQVQGPIQVGARIDEHCGQLRRRRPALGLGHPLEHGVLADPKVHHPRIGLKSRPQPIDVTREQRMQSRLSPLIPVVSHSAEPPRCDDFCFGAPSLNVVPGGVNPLGDAQVGVRATGRGGRRCRWGLGPVRGW